MRFIEFITDKVTHWNKEVAYDLEIHLKVINLLGTIEKRFRGKGIRKA